MKNKFLLAIILFFVMSAVGVYLAGNRPLWNDELYSLNSSILGISYFDILLGKVPEGNTTPLFYIIQKTICSLANYSLPQVWDNRWFVDDVFGQILLRLNPIVFMSLSVSCIFAYFNRRYSIWGGMYSVFMTVSSFMIWTYFAEARPYALWVFLTTIQFLVFLLFVEDIKNRNRYVKVLIGIQFLLAITSVFGVAQIFILSMLLWFWGEKNFKKHLFLTIFPMLIGMYYYFQSPKYNFWFKDSAWQLVKANIPSDRFFVMVVCSLMLLAYWGFGKIKKLDTPRYLNFCRNKLIVFNCFGVTLLTLLAASAVLLIFAFGDTHGSSGFQISNRYFIYLTPIGVIAATLLSLESVKILKGKLWGQWALILFLSAALGFRMLRTYALVKGFYHL